MKTITIGLILAVMAVFATLPMYVGADNPDCFGEVPPATNNETGVVNCQGELMEVEPVASLTIAFLPGVIHGDGTAEGDVDADMLIRRIQVQTLYDSGLIDRVRLIDAAESEAVEWLEAELGDASLLFN